MLTFQQSFSRLSHNHGFWVIFLGAMALVETIMLIYHICLYGFRGNAFAVIFLTSVLLVPTYILMILRLLLWKKNRIVLDVEEY